MVRSTNNLICPLCVSPRCAIWAIKRMRELHGCRANLKYVYNGNDYSRTPFGSLIWSMRPQKTPPCAIPRILVHNMHRSNAVGRRYASPRKKKKKTHTVMLLFTYMGGWDLWADGNDIWHFGLSRQRNQSLKFWHWSVHGSLFCEGSKKAILYRPT